MLVDQLSLVYRTQIEAKNQHPPPPSTPKHSQYAKDPYQEDTNTLMTILAISQYLRGVSR